MGNHKRMLAAVGVMGALALAPGSALAGGNGYPVPKVSGGTGSTKSSTKGAGKTVQHSTPSQLSNSGLSVKVHFTAAGTITVTVTGPGTSGTGKATASKAGNKTVKVTFSKVGASGTKVTITVTFKPSGKKGKASTSKTTVTLG
jgi:hypothetical protein